MQRSKTDPHCLKLKGIGQVVQGTMHRGLTLPWTFTRAACVITWIGAQTSPTEKGEHLLSLHDLHEAIRCVSPAQLVVAQIL